MIFKINEYYNIGPSRPKLNNGGRYYSFKKRKENIVIVYYTSIFRS